MASVAVVLMILALVVYAWGSGTPVHSQPVAVRVSVDGTVIDVAVDPCLSFRINEVRLSASPVADDVVRSDQEMIVSTARIAHRAQSVFRLTSDGSAGNTPFRPLGTLPGGHVFGVYLSYDRASAPRGFTDRAGLSKAFNLHQSAKELADYDRLSSKTCDSY